MTIYYQYESSHPNYDYYYKIERRRIKLFYGDPGSFVSREVHYWECHNPSALNVTVENNVDGSGTVKIQGLDGFKSVQEFNIYKYAREFAFEVNRVLKDDPDKNN